MVAGRAAGEPVGVEGAHALGKPFFDGQVGIGAEAGRVKLFGADFDLGLQLAARIKKRAGLVGHLLGVELAQDRLGLRGQRIKERVRHFVQKQAAAVAFAHRAGGDHEEALFGFDAQDGGLHAGRHGAGVAGALEFVGHEAGAQVEVAGQRGEFAAEGGELPGDGAIGYWRGRSAWSAIPSSWSIRSWIAVRSAGVEHAFKAACSRSHACWRSTRSLASGVSGHLSSGSKQETNGGRSEADFMELTTTKNPLEFRFRNGVSIAGIEHDVPLGGVSQSVEGGGALASQA